MFNDIIESNYSNSSGNVNFESNRNLGLNFDDKSLSNEILYTKYLDNISIFEDNDFPEKDINLNYDVKEHTNATSEVEIKNEISIVKKDSNFIENQKGMKTEKQLSGKKRGRIPNNKKYDEKGNIIKSGEHNKYSDDNIHKKIRTEIKNEFLILSINKHKSKLFFFKIKLIINIVKTMGEILSGEISKPNWNHSKEYNKEKIQELSKDEYFKNLFSISFEDCLKYFRGDIIKSQEYIKGMKTFYDVRYKYEKDDDPDYADEILKFLKEYEKYLDNP